MDFQVSGIIWRLNIFNMNLKINVLLCLIWVPIWCFAQDPVAQKYGSMITTGDLKSNLEILASDALEGRETGKRGQKMAAAFISAHFEELGLVAPVSGSYYQSVPLYANTPSDIYIKTQGVQYNNFEDIIFYGSTSSEAEISLPVVFLGNGQSERYNTTDVKDKAVLILFTATDNFRALIETARQKNAKAIFLLNPDADEFKSLANQFRSFARGGRPSLEKPKSSTGSPVFFVSPVVAEKMMNISLDKLKKASADATGKSLSKIKAGAVTFHTKMDLKTIHTNNVLGYLEGSDKKDEIIVITAHYDHIGKKNGTEGDLINNGADDDGSGTVTVMQLAKVFAQAKKDGKGPRRSILFMTVTGEELGLLGSDYYTQNPVYPLEKTVVNLNIDMVGRRDAQHKDSAPYVYVIGADKLSSELNTLSENVNKMYTNLLFDYTYNDQNHPDRLYYRSDHWNFAKNNIPIIFYFDGIHEDYHRPSDEIEKIEFDLLEKRAKCVFYTAWEIANREQKIVPDQNPKK